MPFITELVKYLNECFIETGTFRGDTIDYVNGFNICKQLYSIEISSEYCKRAVERFKELEHIHIVNGNSRHDLYSIIEPINTEMTFWLDGHWSGGHKSIGTDPEYKCPILFELEQIRQHHIKSHIIIVDDIRLMDNSHFLVTLEEIEKKILEINPEYTIKYYNDEYAENDVLVAYIHKKCVHKYLSVCKTNPQPPGLGDFLRGSIMLYELSKTYKYTLYIDNEHPLFKHLQDSPYIKKNQSLYSNNDVLELIPPMSYEEINQSLILKFQSGEPICLLTNAFYTNVSEDCKDYFKQILRPSIQIQEKIQDIFINIYNISPFMEYTVIHLRFGDRFIHNNHYDSSIYDEYYNKILKLMTNRNCTFILISDSSQIAIRLQEAIPQLKYWDNDKIHLGDLYSYDGNKDTFDTMVDFFILSKANTIFSNGSGFSSHLSHIFDIPYEGL